MFYSKNKFYIGTFYGLIGFDLLILFFLPLNRKVLSSSKNIYISDITISYKKQLKEILRGDLKNNSTFVVNNFLEENDIKTSSVEILSDIQYERDNKFFAEGNVVAIFTDINLRGDKMIYDRNNYDLIVEGNVSFKKGEQYFEADFLKYNIKTGQGLINNIYGLLDLKNAKKDFGIDLNFKPNDGDFLEVSKDIDDIELTSTNEIGLVNDFDMDRKLNIKNASIKIPQIQRWRYKSETIQIKAQALKSDKIYFTNDPYNKPQFIIESKDFTAEIVDKKLQLISNNTWINLDDKFAFPIGKRSIIDKEPISTWTIGSDYPNKDGYYIRKTYNNENFYKNFNLKLTPYFLIQRAIVGNTKAFVGKKKSLLSNKIEDQNSLGDIFALDAQLTKKFNEWNMTLGSNLHSLNLERLNEATNAIFILDRRINFFSKNYMEGQNRYKDIYLKNYKNNLDINLYAAYRKEVTRSFSSNQEIYFAKGISFSNKRIWSFNNGLSNSLNLIYDFGEFKAEALNIKKYKTHKRNMIIANIRNKFPLWKKKVGEEEISSLYKYTPKVINQEIVWNTNFKTALFLYDDNSFQKAISLSSGPKLTLGGLKNNFFDYTTLSILPRYIISSGESPFAFDNINDNARINFKIEQQLFGPMVFGYMTDLNLEKGKFNKPKLALNINRRAYSLRSFYNLQSQTFGINLNVFNFSFSGTGDKF